MHTAHFDGSAAIGLAGAAGNAMPAIKIGNDGNGFAGLKSGCPIEVDKIAGQFMTQNPRVLKKRLRAFECVQVCSADPDAFDLYNGMPRPRQRCVGFTINEFARSIAN